jgi:hypothetical protein
MRLLRGVIEGVLVFAVGGLVYYPFRHHPVEGFIVVIAVCLVLILAITAAETRQRRRRTRPTRRQQKQADQKARQAAEAEAVQQAQQAKLQADQRAARLEQNKRWYAGHRLVQKSFTEESVDFYLHCPLNDTFAMHVGRTATCEIWNGCYSERAENLPFDAEQGHGYFLAVFPEQFVESSPNPWPKGNVQCRVVWRFTDDSDILAESTVKFRDGRLDLFG